MCRVAQPNPWFPLGGGALIGEERHQATSIQGSDGGFESLAVVEDRSVVVVPDELEKMLTKRVMRCSSHPDRIASKEMEDPGHPFPIPVVHGEEEGGGVPLGPRGTQHAERSQVQVVPATGQEEGGLFQGALEKLTRKVFGKTGLHLSGQVQDFVPARNGQEPCQRSRQGTSHPLGRRRAKRKDDAAMVERCRWNAQEVQT